MDHLNNMFTFLAPRLLASIEGGGDGGGGGGGDDDKKKPVTAEDVEKLIKDSLDKSLHGAVKIQLKRALGDDSFKTLIADAVKSTVGDSVKEALAQAKEESGDDPPAPDKGKGGKKTEEEPSAAMVKLQKQLDQMKKERDDEKAARETEKKTREATEERTLLTEALTKGGAAPKRVKGAVALLYGEEKKLARNEKGQVYWKGEDDEELSLEDGVKAWLESEEGQEYMPARQVGGGGGGTGGTPKLGAGGKADANAPLPMSAILGR